MVNVRLLLKWRFNRFISAFVWFQKPGCLRGKPAAYSAQSASLKLGKAPLRG